MGENLRDAVVKLRAEIDELAATVLADPRISKLRKLHSALNSLEDLLDEPRTPFSALLQIEDSSEPQANHIRPDEFYGREPLEAAKLYLRKKGRAMPFKEIVAGIRAGGCTQFDEDALRRSLIRSTYEIAKINDDLFGLLEFYPHIRRGRRRRRTDAALGASFQAGTEDENVASGEEEFADAEEEARDSGEK